MKYLDKLINLIFSLVILVLTAIIVLVSAGFLEYDLVDSFIRTNIFSVDNNTTTCIVALTAFCAALKTTFFLSKTSNKNKSNILVSTTNGIVQIAQETIESTAKNVAKNYDEVKDVQVRMIKIKKAVNIYMSLLVLPRTNIIELSSKVQEEVKDAVQNTTGVKVNNIDIKIKNIAENRVNNNKSKNEIEVKKDEEPKQLIVEEQTVKNEVIETTDDIISVEENSPKEDNV